MWATIRIVAGVILIGVGLVGLLLPILPGIPLLLAGVALLGSRHPWVRPFMARIRLWRRRVSRTPGGRKPDDPDRRPGEVPGR